MNNAIHSILISIELYDAQYEDCSTSLALFLYRCIHKTIPSDWVR
jgi:hypothetical protein